jgi:hypothetical protein
MDITGRVVAEEDGRPLAGVLVRLLSQADSALTDSAGSFRLHLERTGLRPEETAPGRALRARMHAGMLEYAAVSRGTALIDLYGTDGRIRQSLFHHPSSPGIQKVGLAPITAALRGMGWLRIRAEGGTEWVRVLSLGAGMEPVAFAPQGGSAPASTARSLSPQAAALAKSALVIIDSLRAEKPGYYPFTQWIPDSSGGSGQYGLTLWKNPSYGLAPAEVEAWKAHLSKPVMSIRVGPFGIGLPAGLTEGKVELADGTEAASWSTGQCLPGPRPKSVRMAYTRQGREYRDTVSLEPLWKLFDSYRALSVDSLGPYEARYHLTWDWPKGVSALPERDWIELMLIKGFSEDHSYSLPDVFQRGIGRGIEGGVFRYEAFDPARGDWTMKAARGARPGIKAEFTLARREDHDLRIVLEDWGQKPIEPIRFSFVNTWPDGGLLPAGQVLHPQAKIEPAAPYAKLEMIPKGSESGPIVKFPWNGSVLDWSFPFPIRDTLAFRLKAWAATDESGFAEVCDVPALSPVLRAIPSATDSAAYAFEPNDRPSQAALVPAGRWMEAGWDYHPVGETDADHYRFQAPAGTRVRLSLRNPNREEIFLNQSFSDENVGFGAEPDGETSVEYAVEVSGDHLFEVRPYNFPAGRYSFRIDIVP